MSYGQLSGRWGGKTTQTAAAAVVAVAPAAPVETPARLKPPTRSRTRPVFFMRKNAAVVPDEARLSCAACGTEVLTSFAHVAEMVREAGRAPFTVVCGGCKEGN